MGILINLFIGGLVHTVSITLIKKVQQIEQLCLVHEFDLIHDCNSARNRLY